MTPVTGIFSSSHQQSGRHRRGGDWCISAPAAPPAPHLASDLLLPEAPLWEGSGEWNQVRYHRNHYNEVKMWGRGHETACDLFQGGHQGPGEQTHKPTVQFTLHSGVPDPRRPEVWVASQRHLHGGEYRHVAAPHRGRETASPRLRPPVWIPGVDPDQPCLCLQNC